MPDEATTRDLLVIGIGSELRSDDAAGRVVASRVVDLGLPGVEVLSVHQLLPELVEDLAGYPRAVFVDADPQADSLRVGVVVPAGGGARMTHHCTPEGLLGLAVTAGLPVPSAVTIGVPARDLGIGTSLSVPAIAGVEAAVQLIAELASGRGSSAGSGEVTDPQSPGSEAHGALGA